MEKDFIDDAVNAYYHQAEKEIARKDVGDIEKRNWESIRDKCKEYFATASQGSDAVEFAEWIQYFEKSYPVDGKCWTLQDYSDVQNIPGVLFGEHYTTAELYELFKQSPKL